MFENCGYMKRCVCAKLLQLCSTLCYPEDNSWPGSSVHGILQARTLAWFAMPSSRGSSQLRDQTHVSYISCISRWVLYHLESPYEEVIKGYAKKKKGYARKIKKKTK